MVHGFLLQASLLLSSYSAFQRVAVALELVTRDLRAHQQFATKFGRFWRMAQQAANRAVEAAYVALGASVGPGRLVPRAVVPPRMRSKSRASASSAASPSG